MIRRGFLAGSAAALLPTAEAWSSPRHGPLFLNTILLGGSSQERFLATRRAGFDAMEIWTRDVEEMPGGAPAVRTLLGEVDLRVLDYQVLSDFDGAPGLKREDKRAEAISLMEAALAVKTQVLAVPASTDPDCDASRIAEDLAWLVEEARARHLRIAYEGMAWSTFNNTVSKAFAAIRDLDPSRIGLVVDSYHLFVRGGSAKDLDIVPVERIMIVQFCDVREPVAPEDYKTVARTARLIPGDGTLPLGSLAQKLDEMDYRGPVGLEIFNDELKRQPPEPVARRAFKGLTTLLEGRFAK